MKVLVTRPRASGEKTIKRLEALGHNAVSLPLFEPVHDLTAVREAFASTYSSLIVTSAEAIRAVEASGAIPSRVLSLPVLAVGEKTAEAARTAGFRRVEVAAGTGVQLAELVISKRAEMPQPFLYLAGEPRAPYLEERLDEKDVIYRTFVVYRMHPVQMDAVALEGLLSSGIDAVLFYSEETAKRFFELTGVMAAMELEGARFLCLSPKIAQSVPRQFARCIEVAQKPSENSLLELL
jgi:uroporphyrinogen-III synthase